MLRCQRCNYANVCVRHGRYQLVRKEKLKPDMWLNEHVHTAYRPRKMTAKMCVWSVFAWNNETINVWSHLVGLIYFTWMQFNNLFYVFPALGAPSNDRLVTFLSVFGSQVCMALSAGYHTFCCINSSTRKSWLRADVFGISAGLLGIYLGGVYNSFYCFPEIQQAYLLVLALILLITVYVPANQYLVSKRFGRSRFGYLHLTYMLIAVFGLFPTAHWISLHGGLRHPHVTQWLPNIAVLFALVGVAFFFYVTLVPERFFPGCFDYVGCSHQWWHLLILTAMIFWHNAGVDLLAFYHTQPNACRFVGEPGISVRNHSLEL